MDKILKLRQEKSAKFDAMKALSQKADTENRDFTAEEQAQYDTLKAEYKAYDKRIERAEAEAQEEKSLSTVEQKGIRPDVQVGATREEEKPFKSLGEQLLCVAKAAKSPYDTDIRLKKLNEIAAKEAKATGMSEGVPADGGFVVQTDFVQTMMTRTYETGILSRLAQRIQVGANSSGIKYNQVDETSRATGSRMGGITGYWVNEANAPTKSKPKLKQVRIDLEKLACLVYATEELLQDGTALESLVRQGVPMEFGWLLDDAMVNGTGVGLPLGALKSPALVTVAKETNQKAGTILYDNVLKMWSRGHAASRRNAVWYINQDIEPQLYTMNLAVGTGGAPVFVPPGGASASPFGTLFGRPIQPLEQCATLGTLGDIVLANYGEYVLIEKDGLQAASSIHVKFEEGETAFRFVLRTNGKPAWDNALTPANGSNTVSAFVALQTRA